MNTSSISKLINELSIMGKTDEETIEQIVAYGEEAIPELLNSFRTSEFRHGLAYQKDNKLRSISKALLKITEIEKNPHTKKSITDQIISEMTFHLHQDLGHPIDTNLYNKAFESAWVMGQLKNVSVLPDLFKVIKGNYHPYVQESALLALAEIGDEQAIPHLIELINTMDYNVLHAINALVNLGSKAAVPHLIASLDRAGNEDVRASIIWALGQLRDPRATTTLIECVKTYEADMKAVAIEALGYLGDASAIPVLETCLENSLVLHRQDHGGTLWLFRTYRGKKISEMALKALQQMNSLEAANIVEEWRKSQMNKST